MNYKSLLSTIGLLIYSIASSQVINYDQLKATHRLNEVTPAQMQEYKQSLTPIVVDINTPQPAETFTRNKANNCEKWIEPLPGAIPYLVDVDDSPPFRINLPFNFCFYGQNYNVIHVTANGVLSLATDFTQVPTAFTSNPFPLQSVAWADYAMIAPFWTDVHLAGPDNIGTLTYELTNTHLIVTWKNVGYYSQHHDKKCSFQAILTNGSDPILPFGNNIRFNYWDMQWTTGDASDGVNGFGGSPATVGINKGDGINFMQIGTFDHEGTDYDGPYNNADGVSFLDNKTFTFNVCSNNSTNIPPVALRASSCDTLYLCIGDTLPLDYSFLGPEPNQITHINVDTLADLGGNIFHIDTLTIGQRADFSGYVVGLVPDTMAFGFSGIDNGIPRDSNSFNIVIIVTPPPPAPIIIGDRVICNGQSTILSTQIPYDSYLWSPGGQTSSAITVNAAGTYQVAVVGGNCLTPMLSAPFSVLRVDGVQAVIQGPTFICFDDSVALSFAANPNIVHYEWNATDSTHNPYNALAGQYILAITDNQGCTTKDTLVVKQAGVQPIISGNKPFCIGDTIELQGNNPSPKIESYSWTYNGTVLSTADTAVVSQEGNHILMLTDTFGCVGYETLYVNPIQGPNVDIKLNPQYYTHVGGSVEAQSVVTQTELPIDNSSYAWTFNGSNAGNDVNHTFTSFNAAGSYTIGLTVLDTFGCPGTASKDIIAIPEPPNVITSNGDKVNDNFTIPFVDKIKGTNLQVFNRWGDRVFEADDYQNDFNGDKLNEGVYYYVLTFPDNTAYKGSLTIIK